MNIKEIVDEMQNNENEKRLTIKEIVDEMQIIENEKRLTIKKLVDEKIKKNIDDFYSDINGLIQNVYDKLVEIEDTNDYHKKITVSDIEPKDFKYDLIHENYHSLITEPCFKHCYHDIETVMKLKQRNLSPFVFIDINIKSMFSKYEYKDNVMNAFSKLPLNINLNENHNIKIYIKERYQSLILLIIFDSLNYNSSYTFDNYNYVGYLDRIAISFEPQSIAIGYQCNSRY